jgi:hypothetical protein
MEVELRAFPGPPFLAWALRASVAGAIAWILVPNDLRSTLPWLPIAFLSVTALAWAVATRFAEEYRNGFASLALAAAAFAGATVLIHAHTARMCDVALILAAALFGIALVAWQFGFNATAALPGAVTLMNGLLLAGFYETESEVPTASFTFIALSPLLLAPSLLPWWQRHERQGLWLVQAALFLTPLAVAVGLALSYESLSFE